jgi:hypothetical protein
MYLFTFSFLLFSLFFSSCQGLLRATVSHGFNFFALCPSLSPPLTTSYHFSRVAYSSNLKMEVADSSKPTEPIYIRHSHDNLTFIDSLIKDAISSSSYTV